MIKNPGKCGCDCFICPTYKNNIKTIEDRQKCSSGWSKFLNIKLSPEKLRACDGCSVPDSERKVYYLNCKIRKCAIVNEVDNCAYCSGFPCDELLDVHSLQKIRNREDYTKTTGKEISKTDFRYFIEPYAGLIRLKQIRQSISVKEIKDYKKFSAKIKFAQPVNASVNVEILTKIYLLLTSIYIEKNISFARNITIERKREQMLKILWAVFYFGTPDNESKCIELDSKTFMSLKLIGMYHMLVEHLHELKKYDINCEIIPLVEKGWLTPAGGLRKEGWTFSLEFGKSWGNNILVTFKDYVVRLFAAYGNKAFRIFARADLSIM